MEEAGVAIRLDGLITVLGGPDHRTRYANGDEVAYVATVYRATIVDGEPKADGTEVTELRWFGSHELDGAQLSPAARGVASFLGWI
jgi:hypothetical protein